MTKLTISTLYQHVHWLLSMLVVAFNPLLPPPEPEPYQ